MKNSTFFGLCGLLFFAFMGAASAQKSTFKALSAKFDEMTTKSVIMNEIPTKTENSLSAAERAFFDTEDEVFPVAKVTIDDNTVVFVYLTHVNEEGTHHVGLWAMAFDMNGVEQSIETLHKSKKATAKEAFSDVNKYVLRRVSGDKIKFCFITGDDKMTEVSYKVKKKEFTLEEVEW